MTDWLMWLLAWVVFAPFAGVLLGRAIATNPPGGPAVQALQGPAATLRHLGRNES